MNIELCCAEEVAEVLGIEVDTLYRYARKGRIRGMKVGKAWRFLPTDVQKFLDQNAYFVKSPESAPHPEIEPSILPDVLRRAALASGNPRNVTCGFAQVSYAELDGASNQLADSLLGHGIVPGDRVLILLPNSIELIAACFAVWKAGAIVVAETPEIKDEELRHILRDGAPEALIVDRPMAERLEVHRQRLESVRAVYLKDKTSGRPALSGVRVESLDAAFANETSPNLIRLNGASSDDTATITYPRAGGRVGAGVMNTHANWLAGAAFTRQFHGLTQKETVVLPMPLSHSLAMRQMLAHIMAGAGIMLTADLNQVANVAREADSLALALRPEDVKQTMEKCAPALRKLAGAVRYVEIATDPLEEGAFPLLRQALPNAAIHLAWNLTEAYAAFLEAGPSGLAEGIAQMPPALKIAVIDEQRRQVPPGHPGLIQLKGPSLMQGFWGQSDYQAAALKTEGCCPGGHAMTGQQGETILLGHVEEAVEIRGSKVKPAEVEVVMRRHIRVSECAVLGLSGLDGRMSLHAFVVPTNKGALLTEGELKAYCRTFMGSSMVPACIHIQASLPKSPDGQILREELRASASLVVKRSTRRTKGDSTVLLTLPS